MKWIQLNLLFNDDLGLKSVDITHNDTHIESNHHLLQQVAWCLLKSLSINKDDLDFKEELFKLGITTQINEER
jgi:hypothetical protein